MFMDVVQPQRKKISAQHPIIEVFVLVQKFFFTTQSDLELPVVLFTDTLVV